MRDAQARRLCSLSGLAAGEFFEVFGDGVDGGALFFEDLFFDLLVFGAGGLEGAVDGGEFGEVGDFAVVFEAAEEALEDAEGHLAEGVGVLVAVHPLIEVDLGEGFHAVVFVNVEKVGGFDAVADGEGNLFEGLAADGVFAGEGLEELGELGVKEAEEGAHQNLGDAASACGSNAL